MQDTNGNIVATYYYDAFGNILEKTGTADNSILYGGYQYDEETGLYYLNARMYDPITARFLQEDTYKGQYNDPLSLNLYTYCHNEPLMYTDPTGHAEFTLMDAFAIIDKYFQQIDAILKEREGKFLALTVGDFTAERIQATVAIAAMATVFVAALVVAIPAVAFIGGMVTTGLGLGAAIGTVVGAAGVVTVAGMAIAVAESNIEEIYTGISPMRDILLGGNQELYDGVQGTVAALGFTAISIASTYPAPRNSQEQASVGASEGTSEAGQGFNTFYDAKKSLGPAGEGEQWHHIVEQSQIEKSGFDPTQIHNTNNLIAVDKATHANISGYYNTSTFLFTNGLKVRDWLADQSFGFQTQYEFGLKVLKDFGVIK